MWQTVVTIVTLLLAVRGIMWQLPNGQSGLIVLALAGSALLVFPRPVLPRATLVAQVAVSTILILLIPHADESGDLVIAAWAFVQLCLFSMTLIIGGRTAVLATVGVAAFLLLTARLASGDISDGSFASPNDFNLITWTLATFGIASTVRARRQHLEAARERAVRAVQSRETEAQRRVAEERLRIARDLHDAVAHQIAVISMFTGLARTTLTTAPDQAAAALSKAQDATRSVLAELQDIVKVLRASDDEAAGLVAGVDPPAPGSGAIEDLLRSFRDIGLRVVYRETGTERPMAAAASLALYRVVQEALTNTSKYGNGSAEIEVVYGDEAVVTTIRNRVRPTRSLEEPDEPGGSGFGLIGMRERVRLVGGTISHGERDGIFVVRVELPLGDLASGR
ncbi:MAG TPA: histidine kinase [Thermomicrobiales bacterium]|nr:histidine kinase [Thermomicrobiales bacterium]